MNETSSAPPAPKPDSKPAAKPAPKHASWEYERDPEVGEHIYHLALEGRAKGPYRARQVTALLEVAEDGTLAGIVLAQGAPPPPNPRPEPQVQPPDPPRQRPGAA